MLMLLLPMAAEARWKGPRRGSKVPAALKLFIGALYLLEGAPGPHVRASFTPAPSSTALLGPSIIRELFIYAVTTTATVRAGLDHTAVCRRPLG